MTNPHPSFADTDRQSLADALAEVAGGFERLAEVLELIGDYKHVTAALMNDAGQCRAMSSDHRRQAASREAAQSFHDAAAAQLIKALRETRPARLEALTGVGVTR